jgi:hypothetical protein
MKNNGIGITLGILGTAVIGFLAYLLLRKKKEEPVPETVATLNNKGEEIIEDTKVIPEDAKYYFQLKHPTQASYFYTDSILTDSTPNYKDAVGQIYSYTGRRIIFEKNELFNFIGPVTIVPFDKMQVRYYQLFRYSDSKEFYTTDLIWGVPIKKNLLYYVDVKTTQYRGTGFSYLSDTPPSDILTGLKVYVPPIGGVF